MAKTIYTYLHNDDLDGSRIVYMDNCFCKVFKIKRSDTDFLQKFKDELSKPALYILFNKELGKAYIGETDKFYKRIHHHIAGKEFWTEALVFMATDDSLSKTEVQYLEYLAFDKASKMNVFDLKENSQMPTVPHMSLMQQSKTDEFFIYVVLLAKFVGCDIFEPVNHKVRIFLDSVKPKVLPAFPIKYSSEELKGNIYMSLNRQGRYTKRRMVLEIVKEFMRQFPETTFEELRATFKRDYLQRFAQFEFLQNDIESAKNWKELNEDHQHYFVSDEDIIVSGDGVRFVVCVEWDRNNIVNVLGIAQTLGWEYEIL